MVDTIGTFTPENFHAGEYPIAKEISTVAAGESILKYAPVKLTAGTVEPIAAEADIPDVYGIAAESGTDGEEIVVYLTGEFFGSALALEDGVTLDLLKPALRNIGIFLKEGQE